MSWISFLRACPNFLKVQGLLSQKEGGCEPCSQFPAERDLENWMCLLLWLLVIHHSSDSLWKACAGMFLRWWLLHCPCGPCPSHWTYSRVGAAHLQLLAQWKGLLVTLGPLRSKLVAFPHITIPLPPAWGMPHSGRDAGPGSVLHRLGVVELAPVETCPRGFGVGGGSALSVMIWTLPEWLAWNPVLDASGSLKIYELLCYSQAKVPLKCPRLSCSLSSLRATSLESKWAQEVSFCTLITLPHYQAIVKATNIHPKSSP